MSDDADAGERATDAACFAAVRAYPDGDATVDRLALTAADDGYDGIVVRNHGDAMADVDGSAIQDAHGIDVVDAVEIVAEDPSQASGYLGSYRPDRTIVAVHGGTDAMNRFAVDQSAVDVLAHPTAGDGDPDQVLVKTAAQNGVALELSLAPLLGPPGGSRVRAIEELRRLWTLIEHYDAPYVISTGARSHLELRSPRALAALGPTIGLTASAVRRGLQEWGRVAERNRRRLSDAFVEPGVRREDL